MSLQDITTVLAVFVASISAYALGYSYGLTELVGISAWGLLLPSGLYDASALTFKISFFAPGTLVLAFIYYEAATKLSDAKWRAIIVTVVVMCASMFLMPLFGKNYFHEFTSWMLANVAAGVLVATVVERDSHFRIGLFVIFFFFVILTKGTIDGVKGGEDALVAAETYYIAADDRTYVNARILRITANGLFVLSGRQVIYYPSDRINRIARDLPTL